MRNQTINNLDYQARRALILGQSGMGKTGLATKLIYSHPAPLVLIYDWQGGEFAQRLGASSCLDRDQLRAALERGERLVCYDAESGEADPAGEGFAWFTEMSFELAGQTAGRKLFVADESQELIDPWTIPEGLGNILSRGRRRMVDTCLIGRSANALNTTGRDQVNELYHFRSTDENSLKYPKSLGPDTEQLKTLGKGEFVYRDGETGHSMLVDMGKK